MIARRILVHGRVQGVFFRAWTVETAKRLGLTGWVRNLRSGDVELLAMGSKAQMRDLIEQLHEGPPAAKVARVEVEEADPEETTGFEQRPTA